MSVQVIGSGTIGGIDEGLVVSGIVTATELDISGNIDVDGHTNLDNVSVSGATTCTGGAVFMNSISLNASTNNYLYFNDNLNFMRNGHGNEMMIDSSGRVLINTTNNSNGHIAASNLAVQGADLSIFKDSGGDNTGVSGHKLKFVTQSGSLGELDVLSEGGGGPSGRGGSMRFYTKTNNTASATERLRITSTGNVGMGGNTNPTNVLHIKTAVTNTAVVTIESTATDSYPFLRLKNDAREYQLTCHGGNSDAFVIYDGTSSANRLIIDSNGGVDVVGGYIGRNLSDSFTLNGVNQPHYGFQLNPSSSVPVAMSGYYGIAFATEGTERARIERAGHLVPGTNNSYDLGSSSKRWRNVYTTDLQLSNEGKTNDVDGTWGNYTIQEGESDLFLINNRNGKKYMFLLKEVS